MKKALIILAIILGVLLLFAGLILAYGTSYYEQTVKLQQATIKSWAQMDIQLKGRLDLLPDLIEVVKGYNKGENDVFDKLASMPAKFEKAEGVQEKISVVQEFEWALNQLLAAADKYPPLKADPAFVKLMEELTGAANRVAVEQMGYNHAVEEYNETIKVFPGRFIAVIFSFTPATYYYAKEAEKAARH